MSDLNTTDLTLILPAYNEEDRLEKCVLESIKTIESLGLKYEIIIVENGSTDKTFEIAKSISQKCSTVKAIHLKEPSLSGAIRTGYSYANGKIVVNLDVDLSTDMSHMKELLEYSKDYDVVTGSRYLDKTMVNRTWKRLFLSKVFNWFLMRFLLHSKIKDNNCGFRALKREVGINLFDEIKNDGVFGLIELMILAQRRGYKIKEFPVKWTENERKITIKDIMKYLVPSFELWFRLLSDQTHRKT